VGLQCEVEKFAVARVADPRDLSLFPVRNGAHFFPTQRSGVKFPWYWKGCIETLFWLVLRIRRSLHAFAPLTWMTMLTIY